jgi:pheromone shutdown protein TraB
MTTHEFNNPRNIFEKLKRDNHRLDLEMNGDNMYNFIMTANHLHESIKHWDMAVTGVVKRFQKRVENDEKMKLCSQVVAAKSALILDSNENSLIVKIGETVFSTEEFRKDLMNLMEVFFK